MKHTRMTRPQPSRRSAPHGLLLRGREHARHPPGRMHRLRGARAKCPVDAIKPGTEPGLEKWLSLNAEYAKIWPNITVKKEIISERNGRAAQTRLGWLQRPRSVALPDLEAHPCPAPSACGPHCSTPRKKKEFVAGSPRQR